MSETDSLDEIRAFILEKEAARQRRIPEDPHSFLEELAGLTEEPSDEVLGSILGDEIYLKRIWDGIFLLASKLREEKDFRWKQCEPVIRNFLNRVEPFVFPEDDPFSQLFKSAVYKSIFGQEEESANDPRTTS